MWIMLNEPWYNELIGIFLKGLFIDKKGGNRTVLCMRSTWREEISSNLDEGPT